MTRHSALVYVLKGLLPYTRQNLLLTYKPSRFFYELSQQSGHSQAALRSAFRRAEHAGLITNSTVPALTAKGRQKLQPFVAEKLGRNAKLLVIFDIPESAAHLRRELRALLRKLGFNQVQLSVWITSYDHREVITEAIEELGLAKYVEMYEAARIFPR
jgi:CRISPR-associated endonuclease Cas2